MSTFNFGINWFLCLLLTLAGVGCTGGFRADQPFSSVDESSSSLTAKLISGGADLKVVTPVQSVDQGKCSSAVGISLQNASGSAVTFTGSIGVPLTASPQIVTFYSDSACATAIT